MIPLNEIFEVTYGNKFDLNKMEPLPRSNGGISFVGRSEKNLGVSATVAPIEDVPPYAAGCITVALGGSILASFVQLAPFYTAQNVAVLRPRTPLSFKQKLLVCSYIRANKFRYGTFGREANRTIRTLLIPDIRTDLPSWLDSVESPIANLSAIQAPLSKGNPLPLSTQSWRPFKMGQIFDIRRGSRITKANQKPGRTPFIGAIDRNNGVSAYIDTEPLHPGGTITVNYNGSVAEAFYQPEDYWCSDDVNVLYPRHAEKFIPTVGLFLVAVLRREKFRFNYGRKWNLERMQATEISLPAIKGEESGWQPDWGYMDQFMRQLRYSAQLKPEAA